MSAIIEGFDKPKNCHACPFNNSNCYCNLTKGNIDRDDWDCSVTCPIKELPKGHGDIVDIETLIDMFWDGNSMEITKYDLSVIKPIIEADMESEDKE